MGEPGRGSGAMMLPRGKVTKYDVKPVVCGCFVPHARRRASLSADVSARSRARYGNTLQPVGLSVAKRCCHGETRLAGSSEKRRKGVP